MAAFFRGRYGDNDIVTLSAGDLGVARGYAVFDYLLAENGSPAFLHDHIERFFASAEGLHLQPPYNKAQTCQVIRQLLDMSPHRYSDIKIWLSAGEGQGLIPGNDPLFYAVTNAWSPPVLPEGVRVITKYYLRDLPSVKHTNYLYAVYLQPILKKANADDVLYIHDGMVTEFPRSSFFMVTREGSIVTNERNVLKGITRHHVLLLAQNMMPVEIRDIELQELDACSEIWMTSTTKGILPVVQLDGKPVGDGRPGPVATRLREAFAAYRNRHLHNFSW